MEGKGRGRVNGGKKGRVKRGKGEGLRVCRQLLYNLSKPKSKLISI
jgi:hypothetical protein